MLAAMTWLDWLLVAIPALLVLQGLAGGGVGVLLSGIARFFMALVLAQIPVVLSVVYLRGPIATLAAKTGLEVPIASLIVGGVVFLVSAILIFKLLGMLRAGLAAMLNASSAGRFIDRLLGIPAGVAVGLVVATAFVALPALYLKNGLKLTDRQPEAVRQSVLLPYFERTLRQAEKSMPKPGLGPSLGPVLGPGAQPAPKG